MKHFSIIAIVISCAIRCSGQDSLSLTFLEPEVLKMHSSSRFMKSPDKLIYTDKFPFNIYTEERFKSLLSKRKISGITLETQSNSIVLSKSEKQLLKHHTKIYDSLILPDNLFKNSTLISLDTLNAILNDEKRGWTYFQKEYSSNYLHILKPFFFRNNSLCLTYLVVITSPHDFEDKLIIYKIINGKWQEWIIALSGIT